MWLGIKKFFRHSEVLFWARLQALLGGAAVALTYVDPEMVKAVITPDRVPWFILANGIATEYLRRRRASDLK